MSILITKETKVLVQGMTGKEGQKAAKAMLEYHTNVVCGVTPKKGGEMVEGKPVFNSVKEAMEFIENSLASSSVETPPYTPTIPPAGGTPPKAVASPLPGI